MRAPTRLQLIWLRLCDRLRELLYVATYREVKVVNQYVDGEGYEFEMHRRFVSPVGRLRKPVADVCRAADPLPRWIGLNRYPHQAIGVAIRLPRVSNANMVFPIVGPPDHVYLYLSVRWAYPAKWKDHD